VANLRPGEGEIAPARDRLEIVRERARTEAEREALLQSIVDYMERERAMTNRLAEQSALLELAPDPVFARDADRRITYWNEAAELTYGFSREEAIGRDPGDLLQTEYPIALEEIERQVDEHGIWQGDLVQTTKDGRRLTVAGRWGAMYDEDGHLAGLLEVNRDVTERLEKQGERERSRSQLERERMSARLVRSQRLESLGHLAGGIAHDFNNLLAVISGYSHVGLRRLGELRERIGEESFSRFENDLQQIAQAADRAAGLTHQLLAFARQDQVQTDVIDVNAAITEMLELLTRTLGSHIELDTDLDPEIYPVLIDPGQLGQILVNLAVNSRDAMPDGGSLTIQTDRAWFSEDQPLSHGLLPAGPYVRMRVNDSGVGMERDVAEHAFDPFFTTRPVGEGTGLGLATVYGIVSQAGGQVELYSEPGAGTTVTVLLPATEAPLSETAGTPSAPRPAGGGVVLVVEDEPALREVIARNLGDAGYTVLRAGGGEQALAIAADAAQPIDLLLTDVVMPGMLGPQLADELLRTRPAVKVVFMSGFAHPFVARNTESLQGPLLQKPFTEAEMLTRIAECLEPDAA
jgi:hypothetical protein